MTVGRWPGQEERRLGLRGEPAVVAGLLRVVDDGRDLPDPVLGPAAGVLAGLDPGAVGILDPAGLTGVALVRLVGAVAVRADTDVVRDLVDVEVRDVHQEADVGAEALVLVHREADVGEVTGDLGHHRDGITGGDRGVPGPRIVDVEALRQLVGAGAVLLVRVPAPLVAGVLEPLVDRAVAVVVAPVVELGRAGVDGDVVVVAVVVVLDPPRGAGRDVGERVRLVGVAVVVAVFVAVAGDGGGLVFADVPLVDHAVAVVVVAVADLGRAGVDVRVVVVAVLVGVVAVVVRVGVRVVALRVRGVEPAVAVVVLAVVAGLVGPRVDVLVVVVAVAVGHGPAVAVVVDVVVADLAVDALLVDRRPIEAAGEGQGREQGHQDADAVHEELQVMSPQGQR